MRSEIIPLNYIQLVEFDRHFLECSWRWLQDEELRKLIMAPVFDKVRQEEWFASLSEKKDYLIWGVAAAGEPIGVCGLKHLTADTGEYWAYIGNKMFWGRGIGGEILQRLLAIAKGMGLKSLSLRVWTENLRAISLYRKFGFIESRDSNNANALAMILMF